jgi:phenylalanine ammonia-lyase
VTTEVNSSESWPLRAPRPYPHHFPAATDNPLIEPPSESNNQTGQIHHAGNFQALALTNAMDHVRLSLAHIGKLLFVQLTEIVNPAMNRGLFPNLAGGEVGLDFGFKVHDCQCVDWMIDGNQFG